MQTFIGQVTAKHSPTTIKVLIRRRFRHPVYRKSLTRTQNYLVQDDMNAQVGDMVKFIPCKPISKLKRWKVIQVVGKDETVIVKTENISAEIEPAKVEKTTKKAKAQAAKPAKAKASTAKTSSK